LAAELGLELDSFVFVQSDPSGCSEVEAVCPEVLTLQVPTDPAEIPTWLKHVWAFDRNASST
jgi:predicted enzyme involved in methoxymalonyl-ACP biosynthesis